MAEHIGIVTEVREKGLARIVADRKKACGGCDHMGGGCRACLSGSSRIESDATNPVGAKPGDLVRLEMPTGRLYASAAMIYGLPVIAMAVGAVAGSQIYDAQAAAGETGAIVGALLGFVLGFGLLMIVDRSRKLRARWLPTITAVIRPGVGAPPDKPGKREATSCCSR